MSPTDALLSVVLANQATMLRSIALLHSSTAINQPTFAQALRDQADHTEKVIERLKK